MCIRDRVGIEPGAPPHLFLAPDEPVPREPSREEDGPPRQEIQEEDPVDPEDEDDRVGQNDESPEQAADQGFIERDVFPVGNVELDAGVLSAESKGRVAVGHVEQGGVEPEIPVEDAQLRVKPVARVSAREQDHPEGQELQDAAPEADEQEGDGVGNEDIENAKEGAEQEFASGIRLLLSLIHI